MKRQATLDIPKKRLGKVAGDPVKSAELFKLVYINGSEQGITRKKSGKKFRYYKNGSQIKDQDVVSRINKLAIPPAWTNVWISDKANGHLQATGLDAINRKQYRYHPLWN